MLGRVGSGPINTCTDSSSIHPVGPKALTVYVPDWFTTGDPNSVPLLKYWKIVPMGNVLADVFISVLKLIVDGEQTGAGVFNTRIGACVTTTGMDAWQPPVPPVATRVCVPGPADDGLK